MTHAVLWHPTRLPASVPMVCLILDINTDRHHGDSDCTFTHRLSVLETDQCSSSSQCTWPAQCSTRWKCPSLQLLSHWVRAQGTPSSPDPYTAGIPHGYGLLSSSANKPASAGAGFSTRVGCLQERLKNLKKQYGGVSLGEVTVDMAIGGMRGIPVSCKRSLFKPDHVYGMQLVDAASCLACRAFCRSHT